METVTVQRQFDAAESRIRAVLEDPPKFFAAAGFDVEREGNHLTLTKRVAVTQFELEVRVLDESAALAYEQVSGPFETMTTRYVVESESPGSRLRIETAFEAPAAGVGSFLNGAVIKHQRGAELDAVTSLLTDENGPGHRPDGTRPVESRGG